MTDQEFDQLWMIVSMLPGVSRNTRPEGYPDESLLYEPSGGNWLLAISPSSGRAVWSRNGAIIWRRICSDEITYEKALRDVMQWYEQLREASE